MSDEAEKQHDVPPEAQHPTAVGHAAHQHDSAATQAAAVSTDAVNPEDEGLVPQPELEEPKEEAEWADDDYIAEQTVRRAAQRAAEMEEADDVKPLEEISEEVPTTPVLSDDAQPFNWYILKVQSNREDSIADSLKRRVKVAGMDHYFQEIVVPVEMVTEFKAGKKRIVRRKLYPGYIVVHMSISEESWFLVRETPGIGDFTGSAGRPTPMLSTEVSRIVKKDDAKSGEEPKTLIGVKLGERVKINEGTFENFEGEVSKIDEANGRVTVMINIFGRSTPVELEHWQIETL
ncbi:MAG: transcription termination/antitermination protein NusG [Planctomycetia bacterium]|nr:transcription termination/antitermination protein NusG [Planctomycetia bacterium]